MLILVLHEQKKVPVPARCISNLCTYRHCFVNSIDPPNQTKTGEDEFLTKPTGFRGSNSNRVGFKAPGLVYYANDYTAVGAVFAVVPSSTSFASDRSRASLFRCLGRASAREGGTDSNQRVVKRMACYLRATSRTFSVF